MLRKVDTRPAQKVGKSVIARRTYWPRPLNIEALKSGRVQPDLSRQIRASGGFSLKWSYLKGNSHG
ncbi:hypothetical protein [Acetobacter okinawensis]|uniref:hypothetical protein n=1 Tax=Acetobacter okinawensis TaxID=1076594 RepID=UPI0039E98B67